MNDSRYYFEKWFKEPLERLYSDEHSGFVILMISLPLLERYLRSKTGIDESPQLDSRFHQHLVQMFPALGDVPTAKIFWRIYRHGLLHQATLKSEQGTVEVSVRSRATSPITVLSTSDGWKFQVSPELLSRQVLAEIETHFSIFEAPASAEHPLSTVTLRQEHQAFLDGSSRF